MSLKCTTTCDQCQTDISDVLQISLSRYQDQRNEAPELDRNKHFCDRTCLEKWLSFPPNIKTEGTA